MMKASSRPHGLSKPRIVDLREAAVILKLDSMKLFKMVRSGKVPGSFQVGLAWRLDLDELERFLETKPRGD
jgi:excisionase family DNA binding protein